MTKWVLRFLLDFGAGGCLWPGDEAAAAKLGNGPLDAAVYNLQGHAVAPPRIPLPSKVYALISRLDQEYSCYLNPSYPPDPSLWTQARCDRFNNDVDHLLVMLQAELRTDFVIVDQQKRHAEDPALGKFLAENPDQKAIP